MLKSALAFLASITLIMALSGCGQTGPLYIPTKPDAPAKPASATHAHDHTTP